MTATTALPADPGLPCAPTSNGRLLAWVARTAALTGPERVVWCDGSEEEWRRLTSEMVAAGTLVRLDPSRRPNSFLARTAPHDATAAVERTFTACHRREDAGPGARWREPTALREELEALFEGCMRGRTMYVVPFCLGQPGGPAPLVGVQVTDSPYVVAVLSRLAWTGRVALDLLGDGASFVQVVHSVGFPLVDVLGRARPDVPWPSSELKYVATFPETRQVWSYGSAHRDNAVPAGADSGLRLASAAGREGGWLAERMTLLRVTSPEGRAFHVGAVLASGGGSGPASLRAPLPGWQVETLGGSVAALRPGPDGRLRASSPDAGFSGTAPGTAGGAAAADALRADALFTNVALTDDGDVWWEGLTAEPPAHLVDWRGADWAPGSPAPAAHPAGSFVVPATRCSSLALDWDDPAGFPLDAVVVGGRRAGGTPLVAEAFHTDHGVFLAATAATEDTCGALRREPFALPASAGHHAGEHTAHWLEVLRGLPAEGRPRVFAVNWAARGGDGGGSWPGAAENVRVLAWVCRRLEGTGAATVSPVGWVPTPRALDVSGLDLPAGALERLLEVDVAAWRAECDAVEEWFDLLGERLPVQMRDQLEALRRRLAAA
ncbi:phosphoenolpyruvate carboxykinase (GTP) [Kineococcus sp. NUM-3379]